LSLDYQRVSVILCINKHKKATQMKVIYLTLSALFIMAQTSFAQIKIGNYRMQESQNWSSQNSIDQQQVNQFRAGIANNNEVLLDIKVVMNVEATSYMAIFNIRQVASTALEVNTLLNERVNQFKSSLASIGISDKQCVVEIISQVPIYGLEATKKFFSKSFNEVPIGFELHKNISVTFNEYDLLNDIVFEASKSEIYDLITVDYFAENPVHYFDTMRHAATSYLTSIQKSYSKAGFALDTFDRILAENAGAVYPISRYTRYQGLSKLSYEKLLKSAGSDISADPIASPSMYYNHLPFNDYDIVIHPTVNKPTIQYTLSIQAKYTNYPKPKTKTVEKQFYIITEDGRLQLLDVR
jgi:uncharacterized protein YggE